MKDTMWITELKSYIPKNMGTTTGEEVSKTYIGVYQAYHDFNTLVEEEEETPEEMKMDSDEMAAYVVGQLMESGIETREIQFLVDCRSSITGKIPAPTYKVAVLNDIKSVIPFSIQGQEGTEAVQAFMILKEMMQSRKLTSGCISMVQKLNKGDKKRDKDTYLLGDGAAAIFIKRNARNGFEIVDTSIKRVESGLEDMIIPSVKETCEKNGVQLSELKWLVCHNAKEKICENLERALPTARLLKRTEFSEVDFGCADPFISLSLIEKESWIENGDFGCLIFIGKTNHLGIVLVQFGKGNV